MWSTINGDAAFLADTHAAHGAAWLSRNRTARHDAGPGLGAGHGSGNRASVGDLNILFVDGKRYGVRHVQARYSIKVL